MFDFISGLSKQHLQGLVIEIGSGSAFTKEKCRIPTY
jgi:hypothetical protein